MITTLIRTVILYVFIIAAVRIMGKRQIGELQPSELVITILLSEIAAIPMQDNDIPLLNSFVSVLLLVALEITASCIAIKFPKFRTVMQGNAIYVIKEGKIDTKQMKRLRFTVEDLLEALRQKDIFDISEVEYAVVETNGTLSIMPKAKKRNVTPEDLNIKVKDSGIPCVVVSDGKLVKSNFVYCEMTEEKFKKILRSENKKTEDILIMTIDKDGNKVIVEKEKK